MATWSRAPGLPIASRSSADSTPTPTAHPAERHAGTAGSSERATAPSVPWADLATNRPGAEARAQATALRQQAPVRTFLDRARGRKTEERAWRIGADGEELVGAVLARLVRADPRWRVLHAIPVGVRGSDIDHFVVGPGGAFTLNTKHHPGAALWVGGDTFMVNGHRQPYIRNSRHEAARAGRLLTSALGEPVETQGVVVPVRADRLVVKVPTTDVAVVPARRVVKWLRARPVVLEDQQVAAVFEVARRSTTWQPPKG